MRLLFPLVLLLAGCPSEAPPSTAPGGAAPAGQPPAGPPPAGGQQGAPNAAPSGEAGQGTAPQGGGIPPGGTLPTLKVDAGAGVAVSGTVAYAGAVVGPLRMDVATPNPDGSATVVHAVTLDKPGPFSVELPKGYGKVNISAFIDQNGDGPSTGEPVGSVELTIADAPQEGLTITVTDAPDKGVDPAAAGTEAAGGGTAPKAGVLAAPPAEVVPPPEGAPGAPLDAGAATPK